MSHPSKMTYPEKVEAFGRTIDRLDNLTHALNLPLVPELHVDQLREALPEVVEELKAHFVVWTGENPWD